MKSKAVRHPASIIRNVRYSIATVSINKYRLKSL
ncbi:Uncharacterised protein [Vibrio cholerae]|nr:Uncharacterised protein [Vibrio cholerae]